MSSRAEGQPLPIPSVHRELIIQKGTQLAIEFAENPPRKDWSTHDLVAHVLNGVWKDIKESKT